jgi:hypothetical protein
MGFNSAFKGLINSSEGKDNLKNKNNIVKILFVY